MKNDIREMILENMFDMAVNNQEICRDMNNAYEKWIHLCYDNTPNDMIDNYLELSTDMQRESFLAGSRMTLALIYGGVQNV